MDEDEDYDSDSTVLITDFSKNPEKIARKRRKLDATIRRVSQTNINAASDAENRAPNVTSSTAPRDGKRGRYNDADAEQWRINKFLSKLDPVSNINENDNVSEDLKVRKELLKQKYSDPRISGDQGNDDKEVREDCVVISDDSDDDCTVVNNKLCNQVDKNTNLNSRISVLTPSAINTRRATLDSFESNKTASNNDPVNSTNPNKVNPKLTVLKPSIINARRATINCFEINDGTSKNVIKIGTRRVDFSSNENKDKESHDDKINENVAKQVTETNRLSGQKRTSERPPKPTTPDQNETPRRRNSSDVVQGKPCDLQIRRIISSSKNINENSSVNKIVNQNQSMSSSNVIHSTAEVLASIQKTSGIQEKSNISKVNITDSNQSNLGHDVTMKINTDNDVCEDINDINKINGINSRNSEVNNSKDTTNHMNCQTVNSNKRPVDINIFNNGNENSSVPKSTDANHVTVDRNTLNSSTFTTFVHNTNSLENNILQNLKNMHGKIVQQKEDSGVLNDSDKANGKLSKINKSNDAQQVGTDIQTDDNVALCSNVVTELTNANSSANPVIENLKNIVQRTENKGENKSDEKRNEVNNEQSPNIRNCGQEINFNKLAETGNRKRNCDIRPNKRGSDFHVGFFKDVKQYLKEIFREGKNLDSLRASPNMLKREIKHIIHGAKKHDVAEMQYACPKCSQVSVYSPKAMHQIGNDDNPIVENNTSKCKLCLGLQILHTTNMEVYLELKINKNYDEINTTHQRRQNDVSNQPSGENNRNIASTSALNMTATQNHILSREAVTSFPEVSSKPGQNQNKNRTNIETSRQSDLEVYNNNDTATSGDKAKSHKRKVDDKRSPANPKRVRTNTNSQDKNTKATKKNKNQTELSSTTAVPSSTSEPSTFYNSTSRISNDNAKTYYDTNEGGSTINDTSGNGDKSYTNKDLTNSKALFTKVFVQYFTKLKKSRITTEDIQALEKFIQTTENDDSKTANIQHVCSVCSCVFSSPASLSTHMKENHNWDNIPDKGNVIKCPLCNVHLTETNYIAHVKVHYPEENSEHVGSDDITSINNNCKNQDVSGANTEHQNKANIVTSSGRKQYECAICKKVLYSSFMAKKHRNEVHGHLDLKYKKLYNVTERKGRLERASTEIQSSTSVRNITSEDPTLGNEEEITNQDSERMNEMNRREDNHQMKTNEVTAHRKDDAKKSNNYVKNSNCCTDQISVPKNCHDNCNENTKTNRERKRKASQNSSIIQEVKQAYVKKCKEKTMHKCLICKEIFTDYGSRKHREDKHPEFINRHLFDKLTITDVREINEGKTSDGDTSVKSKTQKDDQYEINLINAFLGELEDEEKSRRSIDDVQDITKTDTVTKPPKSSEDIENNGNAEQTRSPRVNDILQTNADIISESVTLHETNAQKSSADADQSSSQADEHEAMKLGETNDVNMDDTDDPNTKNNSEDSSSKKIGVNETNKSPDISTEENVDGKLNSGDEDTINTEEKKPKRIFPASSKKKPSLANCYNCLTNLDVNDINNHECMKAERTLYNCFSCGVNIHRDETHECENENNSCIENILITKVETVPEVNVFKCEDCNTATDVYDDVIRHCQNHYNNIKDTTAFCPNCQLNYNTSYFETHKHLHENEMKITNYSYKSLFSNWNTVFDNIPTDVVEEMQLRSIYRSHSVRMRVTEEGPWQYSLYQCNQCETCVPPAKLDHHCQKQCCVVAYPCPACERLFPSAEICATHELDHITTKQFKIIEFNCKKDERFNLKLFEARKLEIVSRIPIADIYKCQCGVCFVSNEVFRKHFASCNMETDKGMICHRCAVPRLFEAAELENHLRVHHDSAAYRFRVNQLVIQQEVEPFYFFNQENGGESECRPSPNVSRAEDDIKRELLKQENEDFTV